MIEPIVEFEVVSEENSSLQRQQHGTPLQVGGAELHMRQWGLRLTGWTRFRERGSPRHGHNGGGGGRRVTTGTGQAAVM